jgi:hypothetical protein
MEPQPSIKDPTKPKCILSGIVHLSRTICARALGGNSTYGRWSVWSFTAFQFLPPEPKILKFCQQGTAIAIRCVTPIYHPQINYIIKIFFQTVVYLAL